MTDWTLARIRGYYRQHAALAAAQLNGRDVAYYPPSATSGPPADVAELLALTEAGVGGFLITPRVAGSTDINRMVITLTTGDGADIATAATAALAIGERLALAGHRWVALVDGQGGMMLVIPCRSQHAGAPRAYLDRLLAEYATSAPELATVDLDNGDGRMVVSAAATDPAVFSWAPYSLVPGAWPGVVMPLHADDVAAASAGMPLEIEPEDVADRLRLRGDLFAAR